MSNVNTIDQNIEKAVELIETQKKEIKTQKDSCIKAETRIEENEKGLVSDFKEVEALGFDKDKIDSSIKEMDETLIEYNDEIVKLIASLEGQEN